MFTRQSDATQELFAKNLVLDSIIDAIFNRYPSLLNRVDDSPQRIHYVLIVTIAYK